MAQSPRWKVYREGEYVASCKYVEDAAALVAVFGTGSDIRDGHSFVVWKEGAEDISAAESYDTVAEVAIKRRDDRTQAYLKSVGRAA